MIGDIFRVVNIRASEHKALKHTPYLHVHSHQSWRNCDTTEIPIYMYIYGIYRTGKIDKCSSIKAMCKLINNLSDKVEGGYIFKKPLF